MSSTGKARVLMGNESRIAFLFNQQTKAEDTSDENKCIENRRIRNCSILWKIGFSFREQSTEDYEIDSIVEERADNQLSGKLIGIHMKRGGYLSERKNKVIFQGEIKHYDYWLNYSIPIVTVFYDSEISLCIYESVERDKIIKIDARWKIEIDIDNKFEKSIYCLQSIYDKQSEYQIRLPTLTWSKRLMELAE